MIFERRKIIILALPATSGATGKMGRVAVIVNRKAVIMYPHEACAASGKTIIEGIDPKTGARSTIKVSRWTARSLRRVLLDFAEIAGLSHPKDDIVMKLV
jgi:hypothetical protein